MKSNDYDSRYESDTSRNYIDYRPNSILISRNLFIGSVVETKEDEKCQA